MLTKEDIDLLMKGAVLKSEQMDYLLRQDKTGLIKVYKNGVELPLNKTIDKTWGSKKVVWYNIPYLPVYERNTIRRLQKILKSKLLSIRRIKKDNYSLLQLKVEDTNKLGFKIIMFEIIDGHYDSLLDNEEYFYDEVVKDYTKND